MPGGTILPGYRNELLVAACRSEAVPGTIQEAQYQAAKTDDPTLLLGRIETHPAAVRCASACVGLAVHSDEALRGL